MTTFRLAAILAWLVFLVGGGSGALAQAPRPAFNPLEAFAPLRMPEAVNGYRSSNGAPGPDYWQNRADYRIAAFLDPAAKTLGADETISYTNNSPDALDSLWIHLEQNSYRTDARGGPAGGRTRTDFTDGFVLDQVEVESGGKRVKADYVVAETRMQVRLPKPLPARGGRTVLFIRYHYATPARFGGRTSWAPSQNGDIFDIAQWYPRMAVYDDLHGWDTLPYIGSEFYLEYGRFDYSVTVPTDMVVAGSGELTNPQEVLTPDQRARLAQARLSDRTVVIRTPAEVSAQAPANGGVKTWRFSMENTRDVAFVASRAFVWDAARINLPGAKTSLAMSVYPVESVGDAAWGRSTEYLKHAVEEFSRRWFPYPWPAAINAGGPTSGMEYPGIVFDGMNLKGKDLFWLTAHEIGHSWFPMIVGTNERRHAWMDEGLNTFIDVYESDAFAGGVYGPKRDNEYAAGGGNPADEILKVINDPAAPPIMTPADQFIEPYRHSVSYFKTAFGLVMLREQVLGPDRFDYAFKKFIRDWAYKHPAPSDFFRAMESAGGEDLSWFWRGWFYNQWSLDLAVRKVEYVKADPKQGAQVTVANLGKLVMPSSLKVDFQDGTSRRIAVPVETWMQRAEAVFAVDGTQAITAVTVDADHALPDADRANNVGKP